MAAGFFRKAALEKLSTPEKLDQLIQVTSPKGWIALITIILVLGTGICWSIFGSVKTKLNASGVLLGGEVHEVVSTSQGQLIELKVTIGDKVKEDDVIAIIEQPEILQQIEEAKAIITERKIELNRIISFGNQDNQIQGQLIEEKKDGINAQIETEYKNQGFLKNQLQTEKELLNKGLITKSQVVNTEMQIEASKNTIDNLKNQITQTSSQKLNIDFDKQQRINAQNMRIAEAQRNLEYLKERLDIQTNIRSQYNGEVVEVLTDAGIVVGQGTSLFKLKNIEKHGFNDKKLRGVLYIPSQDGKKIKEGMEALVVPSTVQPQEYGFIKGKVIYVSDFPITQQGMLTSVKNDQLVRSLLSMGALFEVYVEFEKDSSSFSGFKWTSANGPDIFIKEGTSCLGKVTVKTEPPIAIVIPALKKFFDLY